MKGTGGVAEISVTEMIIVFAGRAGATKFIRFDPEFTK